MMTPGNKTSCLVANKGSSSGVPSLVWRALPTVVGRITSSERSLAELDENILMGLAMSAKLPTDGFGDHTVAMLKITHISRGEQQ